MKKRIWISVLLSFSLLLISCGQDASLNEESMNVSDNATSSQIVLECSLAESISLDESQEANSADIAENSANGGMSENLFDNSSDVAESSVDVSEVSRQPTEESMYLENSSASTSSETNTETSPPQQTETGTHTHSYKRTVVNPTCTEKGYTLHQCGCGESYRGEETDALGHDMKMDPKYTVLATDTTRGRYRYVCTRCGAYEDRETHTTAESCALYAQRVLYWLNVYRAEEGVPAAILSNKLNEFAHYRVIQLRTNYAHDRDDMNRAAEATHCGIYYELGQAYGYDAPCWAAKIGGETIGMCGDSTMVGEENLIDSYAREIVEYFRDSPAHWAILTDPEKVYIGIAVGTLYACIDVNATNPDDTGYLHYYEDENGNLCEEWVKE